MSQQITLKADPRSERGKGPAGRLRKQGRVPGIMYGYQVEPTAVSVDQLELFHTLHTDAGLNALIRLEIGGETHLTVARDLQRHPVRRDITHVDFLAVDQDSPISVEVPIHTTDEEDVAPDGGVVNQILYTVPMLVRPLEVPNYLEVSLAGMAIGDVTRVEDLLNQLPADAEFDIEHERTVITVNAPVTEAELEALEDAAGVEQEEPELIGEELPEGEEAPGEAEEGESEDEGEGA